MTMISGFRFLYTFFCFFCIVFISTSYTYSKVNIGRGVGWGWTPGKQGSSLETLVKKSVGRVSTPRTGPGCAHVSGFVMKLALFSCFLACFVYFHKGVRWSWLGVKWKINLQARHIAHHEPSPCTGDLIFFTLACRLRLVSFSIKINQSVDEFDAYRAVSEGAVAVQSLEPTRPTLRCHGVITRLAAAATECSVARFWPDECRSGRQQIHG